MEWLTGFTHSIGNSVEVFGLFFFASLFLSLILTPLSAKFAFLVGAVDQPNKRSVHNLAMPRLGGLGMAIALGVSVLFFLPVNPFIAGFLAGLALIVAVGVADDILQLKARFKLVGQIISILLFISISGYQVSSFGNLFGAGEVTFGVFTPLVTLLCMLAIMNALNLSDGLDGLAGGITAIASLFLGALAIRTGSWETLGILIALAGAVVGFLRYNSHPARMFMGDTGSLLLGYVLAVSCVSLASGSGASEDMKSVAPVTVAIVLYLPLFDALIVMLRRILNRKGAFDADNTHLHHNLIELGIEHGAVVSILYFISFLFGLLALALLDLPELHQMLISVGAALVFFTIVERVRKSNPAGLFNLGASIEKWDQIVLGSIGKLVIRSTGVVAPLLLLALVAPVFIVNDSLGHWGWLALALGVVILASFPWLQRQHHPGLLHGRLYLAIFTLLFYYHVFGIKPYPWLEGYLFWLSMAALAWAAMRFVARGSKQLYLTTGYEVFLLLATWGIPAAILPALTGQQDATIVQAVYAACWQTIPLLLVMRAYVCRLPQHRNFIVLLLVAALFVLGYHYIPDFLMS
ncbi:MAG: MraY family glycosyltransferase [Pseudomonadota bacterium]